MRRLALLLPLIALAAAPAPAEPVLLELPENGCVRSGAGRVLEDKLSQLAPAHTEDPATPLPNGVYTNAELAVLFRIKDGEATLVKDLSPGRSRETLMIPDRFGGVPVTEVNWNAFADCRNLRSVSFPPSVRRIDAKAFSGCSSLTNVVLGPGVEDIEEGVFQNCNAIEAFEIGAKLTRFSAEDDYSESFGFDTSSIPRGARKLRLRLDPANSHFKLVEESLCSADGKTLVLNPASVGLAIPAGVKEIDDGAIEGLSAKDPRLVVPDGVKRIGRDNFMGIKGLREVVLPDSVRRIEDRAFSSCPDLESVVIGTGVTTIGEECFSDCPKLESVRIAATNVVVETNAFQWEDDKCKPHAPVVFEIGGKPAALPPYDYEFGVYDCDDDEEEDDDCDDDDCDDDCDDDDCDDDDCDDDDDEDEEIDE